MMLFRIKINNENINLLILQINTIGISLFFQFPFYLSEVDLFHSGLFILLSSDLLEEWMHHCFGGSDSFPWDVFKNPVQ